MFLLSLFCPRYHSTMMICSISLRHRSSPSRLSLTNCPRSSQCEKPTVAYRSIIFRLQNLFALPIGVRSGLVDRCKRSQQLALTCLRHMETNLKFNICQLETSYLRNKDVKDLPTRIERHIPTYLSYACRFWAVHLEDSGERHTIIHHRNVKLTQCLGCGFFIG
jgi:hypothetical protein